MSIIALIRVALEAFLEISKNFKLLVAANQRNNELKWLELKSRALQDTRDAITEEQYKTAVKELRDSILGL